MQERTTSQATGSLPKLAKQHKKWTLDCFFFKNINIPPDCFVIYHVGSLILYV